MEMRTIIEKKSTDIEPPDLLLVRHPTVQAFVDKKVAQARESLKNVNLSFLQKNQHPVK
jgi:hypothetical protein